MFPIIEVPKDAADSVEQLGSKPKFWFTREGTSWLFKECVENTGEDWSEKISGKLYEMVGFPHVEYELAIWKGKKGVVCPTFVPPQSALIHGNELMAKVIKSYPQSPERKFFRTPQYTLGRVLAILNLSPITLPLGFENALPVKKAIDLFIGYLMMDAWMANQDRHHENWSFVVTIKPPNLHLAPSYDHAASLGSHESNRIRQERLTTKDTRRSMSMYVQKATSPFYQNPTASKPLSTIQAFEEACKIRPEAGKIWLSLLEKLSFPDIINIFNQIDRSRISQPEIDFAISILELNRERLLRLGV